MNAGLPCSLYHLPVRGVKVAVAYVVRYAAVKEEYVLSHYSHVAPEGYPCEIPYVGAVYGYAALLRVVKPRYEVAECGLAAAGGAYQSHRLPCGYAEVQVLYHLLRPLGVAVFIPEGYVLKGDIPHQPACVYGVWGVLLRRLVHNFRKPLKARRTRLKLLEHVDYLSDGVKKVGYHKKERGVFAGVYAAPEEEKAAKKEYCQIGKVHQQLRLGKEPGHGLVILAPDACELAVEHVKELQFVILSGVGPGYPYA